MLLTMNADASRLLSGSKGKDLIDRVFKRYDQDQDGKLSRAEHAEVVRDTQDVLDTSRLNPIPRVSARKRRMAYDNVDTNGDGMIDRRELQASVDGIRTKGMVVTTVVVALAIGIIAFVMYNKRRAKTAKGAKNA